jgi:hypothetical protein
MVSLQILDLNRISTEGIRDSCERFDELSGSCYFHLDLKHIALPGNHFIQHGIDEKSDEKAGD